MGSPNVSEVLHIREAGLHWGGKQRYAEFTQKGRQHSAFGFGPVGVAFVAATALSNAHARNVLDWRLIRIADGAGTRFDFLTWQKASEVLRVLGPIAAALEKQFPSVPVAPPGLPAIAPYELGVADELAKLAALGDSGVPTEEEFALQKAALLKH
jgi:hypothetical protein